MAHTYPNGFSHLQPGDQSKFSLSYMSCVSFINYVKAGHGEERMAIG